MTRFKKKKNGDSACKAAGMRATVTMLEPKKASACKNKKAEKRVKEFFLTTKFNIYFKSIKTAVNWSKFVSKSYIFCVNFLQKIQRNDTIKFFYLFL